ncbi:MAG: tetratricopeptide repeat protein [Blastocatellia bacterium]|nr:tetratricopeptide repeat protein [Blastocatellia bacterium]
MKYFGIFWLFCFLSISLGNIAFAQDEDNRLPTKIGENSTNTSKGNLSGKVTLRGLDPSQPRPPVFVLVFLNGVLMDRRQVFDNGNYNVPNVPRENVTVAIEVNGAEVGRQQVPSSLIGSIRQDFEINLLQGQNSNAKTGVISAKSLYSRSAENEKLFEKAMSAAKDKKPDAAINLFKQIVANDPKDFVAWTELATLYFRSEKNSEAEAAYTKALELKPDFIVALTNFGRFYLVEKQPDKAVTILTKAVETDATSANAQHLLGEAYLQNKKGSKAVVHLNEAIRLAPLEKAEIHLRLATLYNAAGMKEKAVEEYKQFLEKVPKHPDKEKIEKYIKENSPK